ncbi:MAG: 4a-hydroxytetrahydrobiopterin dehydratase [Planctomycetes bacterium]|nr:4a-hydroxytetrahydrobiopterin dehydratase [Planctomycetota bacterium]
MPTPLDPTQLAAALLRLPGWRHEYHALTRTWRFATFLDAMAFMADAAPEIDRLGHHPDWRNSYDRVVVRLTTHDAGDRVTASDVALAKVLDWVAARHEGGG